MCKTRVYVLYNGSSLANTTLCTNHEQVFLKCQNGHGWYLIKFYYCNILLLNSHPCMNILNLGQSLYKKMLNESPTRDFKNIFNRHNFFGKQKKNHFGWTFKVKAQFWPFKNSFNYHFVKVLKKKNSHHPLLFQSSTHA